MAGKALKDVNNLCKCPVCGGTKRMHHLCETCMNSKISPVRTPWLRSQLTREYRNEKHDGSEEPEQASRDNDRKDDQCGMNNRRTNTLLELAGI